MSIKDFEDFQKKFRTMHRDDMYHVIRANDRTGMFSAVVNTFLISFAIGFHKGLRTHVGGPGAINHVNSSAMTPEQEDVIITLILDRHPDVEDKATLWSLVEEYAEGGIAVLFESLTISEWVLDIQQIMCSVKPREH